MALHTAAVAHTAPAAARLSRLAGQLVPAQQLQHQLQQPVNSAGSAAGAAPAATSITPREQLPPHQPLSTQELFAALDSTYGSALHPLNYVRGIGVCARLRYAIMKGRVQGPAVALAKAFAASAPAAADMEPVSASAFAFLEELASLTDDKYEKEAIMKPLVDFAQRYIDEADAETGRAEGLLNKGNWCEVGAQCEHTVALVCILALSPTAKVLALALVCILVLSRRTCFSPV
eukprot:SAG31_NODE_2622_length_5362_cov_2.274178_2_plen_233_part_00